MAREEVLAKAVEARRARPITAVEQRARYGLVERLLVVDTSAAEMLRICRERFQMSPGAVERVKARVFKAWVRQDAELSCYRKAQARRRLLRVIAKALRAGDLRAAIAAEQLLARIDGIIATDRVRVDVNGVGDVQNAALVHIIGGMSAEERERLLREYELLESLAARALN